MPVWKLADSKGMEAAAAAPSVTRSTATVHPIRPAMISAVHEACAGRQTSLKQDRRRCVCMQGGKCVARPCLLPTWSVCLREAVGISERGVLLMASIRHLACMGDDVGSIWQVVHRFLISARGLDGS
jgi:hypothetical protein